MTRFDYIGNNITVIKEGIMLGVISTCILSHFRIYSQLQNYLLMGYSITNAALIIAEDNKLSQDMIFKIKKEMEAEI